MESLEKIYPVSRSYLSPEDWKAYETQMEAGKTPEDFPGLLAETFPAGDPLDFLFDLARLEWARYQAGPGDAGGDPEPDRVIVNPALQLLRVSYRNLVPLAQAAGRKQGPLPRNRARSGSWSGGGWRRGRFYPGRPGKKTC